MNEYGAFYTCNVCGEEFWSTNETMVTARRKEYKNDAVTTTIWEFHICDKCLKKIAGSE